MNLPENDHEARGLDTMHNGAISGHRHTYRQPRGTHWQPSCPPVGSPVARARGRARYTAAIDRAGHDSEHNTGNDK
jgi:hypothetical protein